MQGGQMRKKRGEHVLRNAKPILSVQGKQQRVCCVLVRSLALKGPQWVVKTGAGACLGTDLYIYFRFKLLKVDN